MPNAGNSSVDVGRNIAPLNTSTLAIQGKLSSALFVILMLVMMAEVAIAESSAVATRLISPLWVRSVPDNWPPRSGAPGLVLSDILRTNGGNLILLGKVDGKPTLLVDPETSGPGKMMPLPISGDRLRLAEGKDGFLWIGGSKNERYEGIGSNHVSEALLVKLDRGGHIVWEHSFGTDTQRTLESLASLPSGAIVASGRDNNRNWLARISAEGQIEWERLIGFGRGTSVSVASDTVFLVGLDASHEDGDNYQEDVVLWSFESTSGKVLDRRIVRERVTTAKNAFLGTIKAQHSGDAIYVFSSGSDRYSDVPIEVAKLGYNGQLFWRTELAQTVQRQPSGGFRSCLSSGVTLLNNGDPLIACALRDQVTIFRIGSLTGAAEQTSLLLPVCHHDFAAALFLTQQSSQSVWIFGSRPENVYKESCTWLGAITLAS